jgi:hypothetical protein
MTELQVPKSDDGSVNLNSNGADASIERVAIGKSFPVGWETVSDELTSSREEGHIIFLIVDDYTEYCLWDKYLYDIAPSMGVRPDFRDQNGQPSKDLSSSLKDLPAGDFMVFNIMHTMASDALYGKAGITKPKFEQLPAIYAIKIGKEEGRYVHQAKVEKAEAFMKNVLEYWKE